MAVYTHCLQQSTMTKIHSYSIFHKVSMPNTSFSLNLATSSTMHSHTIHMLWRDSLLLVSGFLGHSWEHTYLLWLPPQVLFKCTPPFYTFKKSPRFYYGRCYIYFCVLNYLSWSHHVCVLLQCPNSDHIISQLYCSLVVHLTQCMAEPAWKDIYMFLFFSFSPPIWKVPWAMYIGMCAICLKFSTKHLELFVNSVWRYEAPMQCIREDCGCLVVVA